MSQGAIRLGAFVYLRGHRQDSVRGTVNNKAVSFLRAWEEIGMSKQCQFCVTRRQFLRAAGGAVACLGLMPYTEAFAQTMPISRTPIFPKSRANVALVFSHRDSGIPTWPMKDYDYEGRAKEFTDKLRQACPGVLFNVEHARNAEEAQAIIKKHPGVDGFMVYCLGLWTSAPNTLMHSGKPVVMVDDLFAGSGEVLITNATVRREKLPVVTISSSDFQDAVDGANLFRVIHSMKESTVLDVLDHDISGWAPKLAEAYGINVVKMDSKELASYYDAADAKEAAQWADFWMRGAKKVVEPTRDEIIKSGKMYLALSKACSDKKADAVTLDCLGLFYGGRMTAYPCLSHFQMNNDGGTGVCESDMNSTCTQLMMRYLTGRPGYVSDPVIDTSKDEIIYAHCVSHNRAFGPKGATNPYIIRSHREDDKGAAVQSLLPIGEPITTLETDFLGKRMVIHSGQTVENVDEPKACRTKLAAKTNAQKILDNWDMGWHRVTFYGDYRQQAINLARLLGIAVTEEDKA